MRFVFYLIFAVLAALPAGGHAAAPDWIDLARDADPAGVTVTWAQLKPFNCGDALFKGTYFVTSVRAPVDRFGGLWALELGQLRTLASIPRVRLILAEFAAGENIRGFVTNQKNWFDFFGLNPTDVPLVLSDRLDAAEVQHELRHARDFSAGLYEILLRETAWIEDRADRRSIVVLINELRGYEVEFLHHPDATLKRLQTFDLFWRNIGFRAGVYLNRASSDERRRALTLIESHVITGGDSLFYRNFILNVAHNSNANNVTFYQDERNQLGPVRLNYLTRDLQIEHFAWNERP